MSKDTRTPVRTVVKGKFTVSIFDMQAHEAALIQYADSENSSIAPSPIKKKWTPMDNSKKKRGFDWTSSYKHSA